MRGVLTVTAAALLLAACGQGGGGTANEAADPQSNLAAGTGAPGEDLAGLVGASPRLMGLIDAAGMKPVLSGKEPYTLLAPTDAALDALPAGTLEGLLKPENKARLTALLRGHILPGTIMAADLAKAVDSGGGKAVVATMAGAPVTVTKEGDALVLKAADGATARIVGTEQPARNGVVHQIDKVIVPAA